MGQEFSSGLHNDLKASKHVSGYSARQVESIKEKFELLCDDDLGLDLLKFAKLMKIKEDKLSDAKVIFDFFDMDGSGKIDSYEFLCGLALLGQSSLEEKAKTIFNLYDFDKSQVISFDELVVLARTVLCSMNAMSGKKTLPSITEVENMVKDIFKTYDANGDEGISLQEFTNYIKMDKNLLSCLLSYGFITQDDMGTNFGEVGGLISSWDPFLENEVQREKLLRNNNFEAIKQGNEAVSNIDHEGNLKSSALENETYAGKFAWMKNINDGKPSSFQIKKEMADPPDCSIQMEYVYGYRSWDVRNNLKYCGNTGEIVYHNGAVGICLDPKINKQKHFIEHTDDITCLAVFDTLVATGQVGEKPKLCIWDTSKNCLGKITLSGFIQKGIASVCFSNECKKLAAVGMDEDHCLVIYDLAKAFVPKQNSKPSDSLFASAKISQNPIFECKFDPSENNIFLVGLREITVASLSGSSLKLTKATLSTDKTHSQAFLCVTFMNNNAYVGTFDGAIQAFKLTNYTYQNQYKLHTGAVTTLVTRKQNKGLISGSHDGIIFFWDNAMNHLKKIDAFKDLKAFDGRICSLCEGNNEKILIGTRGSEIIEFDDNDHKSVTIARGHSSGELWGLAVNPVKSNEFVTAGDDGMVMLWDISTKKCIEKIDLNKVGARSCVYKPDGKTITIGCKSGSVFIYESSKLTQIKTLKDREVGITEIKYSPTGTVLAVGGEDSQIIFYSVANNFKIQGRIHGHSQPILHFDFNQSGSVLRSMDESQVLMYWDTNTFKKNVNGLIQYIDEKWASNNCVIGWSLQGIWPKYSLSSDINCVDVSPDNKFLLSGDDYSRLKIFKNPSCIKDSSFITLLGHAAHVTNAKFNFKGTHIISTGGEDNTIIQWSFNSNINEDEKEIVLDIENEEDLPPDLRDIPREKVNVEQLNVSGAMFNKEEEAMGTQFGAIKPFLGEVKNSWPSNFKQPQKCNDSPNGNINLKHIFGYRCFDAKDCVKYSAANKVIFIQAGLGVVMDPVSKIQTFYSQHDDDVISMSLHPKGAIVATGQMAHAGRAKLIDIFVWDSESKQTLSNIKGFFLREIALLRFNTDGSKLLGVGGDDDHSLGIYDWAQSRLITTAKVDKSKVLDCAWKNETEFVTVGVRHIKFWMLQGANLTGKKGVYSGGPETKFDMALCCCFCFPQQICITGGWSGKIYAWQGPTASKGIEAHSGGVRVLLGVKSQLFSGGRDGKIITWTWSGKLVKQTVIVDVPTISSFNPEIRSIDIKMDGTILVGTRGAEIYEIKGESNNKITQGHSEGEVWGLAVSPNEKRFVTSGGDKTIRLWNIENKTMQSCFVSQEEDFRAVDWSSNGKYIVAAGEKGVIYLFNSNSVENYTNKLQSSFLNKPNQWIEDIKISPDNNYVAFGAHGTGPSKIEIMNIVSGKLTKKGQINAGLSGALIHLDWSANSGYLVVNSGAYELKFCDVNNAKQISASSTKDYAWASWTCTFGWPVQGIFPNSDGTDVNTVCRSKNQQILATGDDFSKVNLFKYPSIMPKSHCKSYKGHSSHVTRVKFMDEDNYLISVGGNDKSIILWETDFGANHSENAQQQLEEEQAQENEDIENSLDNEIDYVQKKVIKPKGNMKKQENEEIEEKKQGNLFEKEEAAQGDEFLAVKPWLGAIKSPSDYIKPPLNYDKPPQSKIKLDYVYGYRSKDCKNNVRYLKNSKISYNAAGVGIAMDILNNTQTFFADHTDDVTAIAVHPGGVIVATGELGPKPKIHLWDSNSMLKISTFEKGLTKGIGSISFSASGDKLLAVCIDDNHTIAIFDTKSNTFIASTKGDTAIIVDSTFKEENQFLTVGVKHYKLWTLSGANLNCAKGQFGNNNQILCCVTILNSDILVGACDGNLQVWKGNTCSKAYKIHQRAIDAIYANTSYVLTGGKDNLLNILSSTYQTILAVQIDKLIPEAVEPKIRSACLSSDNKKILIGTIGSEIYELTSSDSKFTNTTKFISKSIMKGHFAASFKWTNEVWGLAIHPDNTHFLTCSDDSTLRAWSLTNKTQEKILYLDIDPGGNKLPLDQATKELQDQAKLRSLAISPNGKFIAVGCKEGSVRIVDYDLWKQIKIIKDRKEWIQDIKFSPNSEYLAVGSHDNFIDVYTVSNNFKRKWPLRKHSSFITHLDWSEDSNFLQSNCGAYELLFWNIATGQHMTSGATELRNEKWNTWTCVLGWPVQGVYLPESDGTDVNAVDRSHKSSGSGYKILASGDDFGKVRLFRYPCLKKGAGYQIGVGHSSHVTNVKWSNTDEYIISTGGEDQCVFQWHVEE